MLVRSFTRSPHFVLIWQKLVMYCFWLAEDLKVVISGKLQFQMICYLVNNGCEVLYKNFISLWSGLKHGHHEQSCFWLAETVKVLFFAMIKAMAAMGNSCFCWAEIFECEFTRHAFWCESKSKMSTLASDWLRHFRFLFYSYCMPSHENCCECFPNGVLLHKEIEGSGWRNELGSWRT